MAACNLFVDEEASNADNDKTKEAPNDAANDGTLVCVARAC